MLTTLTWRLNFHILISFRYRASVKGIKTTPFCQISRLPARAVALHPENLCVSSWPEGLFLPGGCRCIGRVSSQLLFFLVSPSGP